MNDEPWERLVVADAALAEARVDLFTAGAEIPLALALAAPRGRGAALRVLRDSPVELIMSLLSSVFDAATSTHSQVGLARQVIGRIDSGWLSHALDPLVAGMLDRSDLDWSDYRRVAELLSELGQTRLLKRVVDQASRSEDEDVREVADDFQGC